MEIKSINFPNRKRVLQREHFLQGAATYFACKEGWTVREWSLPGFPLNKKSFDDLSLAPVAGAGLATRIQQWRPQ
jgi:hypothetical protein